ncbi:homoserine dehydrogenase-domain-containing protein [Aspergillus pseudocaelatus]|uniref:Homoserine dehydrogenase n=1 Tax=Aspergillus pseudocaelatus TaxID=1825620 RepID=A0ABQ6W7L6_9EURO|nr:homoserine dehydrogenase-domain-containing protein [Aspergillus pseudocaelatus]
MATTPDEVCIAVIGAGGVGSCFLKQLSYLNKTRPSPRLRLCYIAIIDKALHHADYSEINIDTALDALEDQGQAPPTISWIIDYLSAAPSKVILVDNTSANSLAEAYPQFLRRGISIITPNKKAFSGSYQLWEDIFSSAAAGHSYIFHESSVGAGLPIISTLKDLIITGDEITRIQGVFSGTMSFLFNSFAPTEGQGEKWSVAVRKAKQLGYTEPDPRDDLKGLDVARKLTILGRLAGLPIESPTSFPVQSLIPQELQGVSSGDEFLDRLPEFDQQMEEHKTAAEKEGRFVRFVGSIDMASREVKVGIESFEKTHPIAALQGSDNIISFYTKRYGDNPLIVQGAGAGGDVTAMGVSSDLLKVLSHIAW